MSLGEKKAKLRATIYDLIISSTLLILLLASVIFTAILVSRGKGLMWANIADLVVSSCAFGGWLRSCIDDLADILRLQKEIKDQTEDII